jgi:hypothetical protein
MKCRQCGTEIADKALICYRCGTATTEPTYRPPTTAGRRSRMPLIVIVLTLLIILIGILMMSGIGN